MNQRNPLLVVACLTWIGAGAAFSQENTPNVLGPQIEQLRQYGDTGVNSPPPEESSNISPMPQFAPVSPGDDDLGQQIILKSRANYQPLTVYLGTDATYTSNVGLSDGNEQHDGIWRSTVGVNYAPRIADGILGSISVSQDVFRYDRFDEFNFESLNLGAGISAPVPFLRGVNVALDYNYNRLTSDGYGRQLFAEQTLDLTLWRNFVLSRAHYFYVLGGVQAGWADPQEAARNEATFLAGYHVRLARNFELDVFYRAAYYDYNNVDRGDVNQTIQLTARYNLTRWLAVNATVNAIFNDSDRAGFDYQVNNAGIGLFAHFKF